MSVLILASEDDGEAQRVASAVKATGVKVQWFDSSWFPRTASVHVELAADGWHGHITTPHDLIDLDSLTAIYYGHSEGYRFPIELSEPEQRFATIESRFGLGGLLASLPLRWVSHPSAVADAEYRIRQMSVAAQSGMNMPTSAMTSDLASAVEFCSSQSAIYKAIMHKTVSEEDSVKLIYTTAVTPGQLDGRVSLAPHLFQQNIKKAYDARILVTTQRCFGVSIHSDVAEARQDWRTRYDTLTYDPCEVPASVTNRCHTVLSGLSLRAGVFDFSIDDSGTWWFLEINPNGRWAWLEEITGLPMAEAFAEELTRE